MGATAPMLERAHDGRAKLQVARCNTTGAVALRLSLASSGCSTSHSVPILSALSNGSEARIKAQLGRPDCLTKGLPIGKGLGGWRRWLFSARCSRYDAARGSIGRRKWSLRGPL
jgi:hypothetical protein